MNLNELAKTVKTDKVIDLKTGQVINNRRDNMVDANEYYGQYLKGEDLKEDLKVTIKSVAIENFEERGDLKQKLVVELHELKKTLVLNKTNKDRIIEITGSSETDNWIGKEITLTTIQWEDTKTKEMKPALRIKPKTNETQPGAT